MIGISTSARLPTRPPTSARRRAEPTGEMEKHQLIPIDADQTSRAGPDGSGARADGQHDPDARQIRGIPDVTDGPLQREASPTPDDDQPRRQGRGLRHPAPLMRAGPPDDHDERCRPGPQASSRRGYPRTVCERARVEVGPSPRVRHGHADDRDRDPQRAREPARQRRPRRERRRRPDRRRRPRSRRTIGGGRESGAATSPAQAASTSTVRWSPGRAHAITVEDRQYGNDARSRPYPARHTRGGQARLRDMCVIVADSSSRGPPQSASLGSSA